ncbi:GNAT family N-acetyltransferase [Halobacillus sp. Cin3]|uniref:GNAT family N-acetyltransferase n=1 Tax=Halobacillus sp. Cin3 TaxID=2928441 RepID=UPI00248E0230|nr:GNAT family N-acetyltransferase [Halobacillus sp. Cin3]
MNDEVMIHKREPAAYMDVLLLADESEELIRSYMKEGDFYAITVDGRTAGGCVCTSPDESTIEIKNIALKEAFRRQGIGKAAIKKIEALYRNKRKTDVIVGTSNSSIENLLFYQKAGFRFHSIKKDFFLSYPEPFYENGIRGIDMVVFHKKL